MSKSIQLSKLFVILALSLAILSPISYPHFTKQAFAQSETNQVGWSQPVNLSRSGAASQPRIVASSDGKIQVFWLDRFDGLISAYFDGTSWFNPQLVSLPTQSLNYFMPELIIDGSGWVHAFWQENGLYYSRMPIGGSAWSPAELLAQDALTYDIYNSPDGGLNLAYIRRLKNEVGEPGVYYRKMQGGTTAWGPATALYRSVYYRLLNPGDSSITVADDGEGNIFIAWYNPFELTTVYSVSYDNGQNWTQPYTINISSDATTNHRLIAIPGTTLNIWQSLESSCALYQQDWVYLPKPTELSAGTTITPTQVTTIGWNYPQPILSGLSNCPTGDHFWPKPTEGRIEWLWGEGSSALSLTAWDTAKAQWAIPVSVSLNFEEPGTGKLISLSDLHAAQAGNLFAVTGNDAYGEVWVTTSANSFANLLFSPPPVWNSSQRVTTDTASAMQPTLAMDMNGRSHLIWVQPSTSGIVGASLLYSYLDPSSSRSDQLLLNTIELASSNQNEIVRHPAILAGTDNVLHLVWSGGEQGDILYRHAPVDKTGTISEWFSAQTLSITSYADWPQVGMDQDQNLYVAYAVPINEDRGIYLTISEDQGQTWGNAKKIYDAAQAGFQGVEQPTLAVSSDGVIYLAWVNISPTGNAVPQGIYFSMSNDVGETWSDPIILAGPGYSMPKLVLSASKLQLLYTQAIREYGGVPLTGSVWYRQATAAELITDQESGWGSASRLQGWDQVSLPFGVTADGDPNKGMIHAIAASQIPGSFLYSSWQDDKWSMPETFTLPVTKEAGRGVTIATRPEGGYLAMAWLAEDSPEAPFTGDKNSSNTSSSSTNPDSYNLYFAVRSILALELQPMPTSVPTPTIAPSATPVVTKPVPTKTIDLVSAPPPSSQSSLPMIAGVLLSAALVIVIFSWRYISNTRR